MARLNFASLMILLLLACGFAAAANGTRTCADSTFTCICGGCPDNCDSPMYTCTVRGDAEPSCDHKPLLPIKWQDVMLFLVLFVVLALSSAAGIGGGGLIIPLLLIICDFQPYYGVPLSVTSIVGGSIVRFVVQVPQFHPEAKHRRLINFPLVLLLLPSTLCGTVLGVLLNSISPTWLVVSTILFVLSYATYETIKKGLVLHRQEGVRVDVASYKKGDNEDDDALLNVLWPKSVQPQLEMLAADAAPLGDSTSADDDDDHVQSDEQREVQRIKLEESRFPWRYLLASFAFLGALLFISMTKGGRSRTSASFVGVECGTTGYVALVLMQFVMCFACAIGTMVWVRRQFLRRVRCGYPFVKGDLYYTYTRVVVLPACTVVAGFLAGFLGVGAGMIIGPFLLSLGLIPMVSAATTSYMTLFTSSSATVQYIALGRVLPSYGAFLFFLAAIASYVGQRFIVGPIKKRNKTSLLVLMLAGIIGSAAVLLCVTGAIQIKEDFDAGEDFGFKSLCTA